VKMDGKREVCEGKVDEERARKVRLRGGRDRQGELRAVHDGE
jgi:hypothetical protein